MKYEQADTTKKGSDRSQGFAIVIADKMVGHA